MTIIDKRQSISRHQVDLPNGTLLGSEEQLNQPVSVWKDYQKIAFRIAFIFFIALSIPNNPEWYSLVFSIDWTNLHYRDLYDICRFGSGINLFGNTIFGSPLQGYANWIITFLVSVAGGLVWTFISKRSKNEPGEYNKLHYWLRVIVRYRAALGIIGFGMTKLLPVQMPYPSLGVLNSDFGDLTAQKIYWLSVAIVPWYAIFAGVVEVLAGALLFFRKTTFLGAVLLFGALGDIVYVNFAYDGGVHVYSSYFVLLSTFLIIPEIPKFYNLIIKERFTTANYYFPAFAENWQKYTRVGLKTLTLVIFLPLFLWLQLLNFWYDPYKQPSTAGVKKLRGNYAVREYRLNGNVIPFNPLDTNRWQQVTFEKWTSLTFKQNKATFLDLSNGGGDPQKDINRTFEIAGVGGGQRAFHYYADTVEQVLYLQDKFNPTPERRNRAAGAGGDGGTEKNLSAGKAAKKPIVVDEEKGWISQDEFIPKKAWANIGNEVDFIDKRAASARRNREFAKKAPKENRKRFVLNYETEDGSRVILKGLDENKDSIYVVLDRIDRKYAIPPSSLEAGKY